MVMNKPLRIALIVLCVGVIVGASVFSLFACSSDHSANAYGGTVISWVRNYGNLIPLWFNGAYDLDIYPYSTFAHNSSNYLLSNGIVSNGLYNTTEDGVIWSANSVRAYCSATTNNGTCTMNLSQVQPYVVREFSYDLTFPYANSTVTCVMDYTLPSAVSVYNRFTMSYTMCGILYADSYRGPVTSPEFTARMVYHLDDGTDVFSDSIDSYLLSTATSIPLLLTMNYRNNTGNTFSFTSFSVEYTFNGVASSMTFQPRIWGLTESDSYYPEFSAWGSSKYLSAFTDLDDFDNNSFYRAGYADGEKSAKDYYYSMGQSVGYEDGYSVGFESGSQSGYNDGYSAGVETVSAGSWSNLFGSLINAPINAIFGKYDYDLSSPTYGKRVGGLLVLELPLGDTVLNVGNFMMGLLSVSLILLLVKIVLRFLA